MRVFITTILIAILTALCKPLVEQYYDLDFRRWYTTLRSNWQCLEDILVTIACILSIILIDTDAGLLELTLLQSIILLILCFEYTFNLASCFTIFRGERGLRLIVSYRSDSIDIAHDVIGLIGCAYLLYTNCGGGMMVRLLLDVITNLLCRMRENFPEYFYEQSIQAWFCDKLFWAMCIFIRLCYYPFVLLQTLATIIDSISIADHYDL